MKRKLLMAGIGLLFSFVVSIIGNTWNFDYDLMTVFGLINLIISVIGGVISIILLLSRDRKNGMDLLAACGIVLLIGVGVCSAFPMRLGTM